jgi:hypothetical protein
VRKRSPADDLPASQSKSGRPKASSHNRYPVFGIPDNDEACDGRNLKELEKELQRDNPRKDNVLSLLRQTFSMRREDVLKEDADLTVAAILDSHPVLTLPYAVSELHMYIFLFSMHDGTDTTLGTFYNL